EKVDIIVAAGAAVTRPANEVTSTIPIVMAQDPDPVANGFVASLARPGGNITGLSTFRPELSGKRLELLKEVIPKLSRVEVFGTSTTLIIMKAMQTVTAVLGRTDRGGDTLWKTLHWMFTSITPGHESRTEKGNSCMGVGWPIVVGTSRTSLSD